MNAVPSIPALLGPAYPCQSLGQARTTWATTALGVTDASSAVGTLLESVPNAGVTSIGAGLEFGASRVWLRKEVTYVLVTGFSLPFALAGKTEMHLMPRTARSLLALAQP